GFKIRAATWRDLEKKSDSPRVIPRSSYSAGARWVRVRPQPASRRSKQEIGRLLFLRCVAPLAGCAPQI
ncbi:unnamed protein product, partial [Urochloa humidicola]